jgi:heterodisulfide reductase subunit C
MTPSNGAATGQDFLAEVVEASGQPLRACLQCGKCSGGCPIASAEVGGPRRLIAEILYDAKQRALEDRTWWRCVACGTCATRCPVEIDVSRVATALCEIAEREGVAPAEPHIHLFEELFLRSVERHGRVNELRVAAAFNLRSGQPLKDARPALALLRKRAISLGDVLRGGRADERVSRVFARARRGGTER